MLRQRRAVAGQSRSSRGEHALPRMCNRAQRCGEASPRRLEHPLMDAAAEPKNQQAYDLFLRSLAVPFDPETNPKGTRCWRERSSSIHIRAGVAHSWATVLRGGTGS